MSMQSTLRLRYTRCAAFEQVCLALVTASQNGISNDCESPIRRLEGWLITKEGWQSIL